MGRKGEKGEEYLVKKGGKHDKMKRNGGRKIS